MTSGSLRAPRLLLRSVGYEFRKRIQFRTGFVVRELLHGVIEPVCMLFVYVALYRSTSGGDTALGGWTLPEILRYIAGLLVIRRVIFDNRALDVATEIFEGRITKYLVMPFRFFLLVQARWVQYTLMQLVMASFVWCVGYAILGDRWLIPVSWEAAAQAITLVLLGSYCCFLLFMTLNTLAFWLDVVWSLLVMSWFVISFTGGATIPVSQMPEVLQPVFAWGFPYWTITAPLEILMGRLGSDAFLRGVLILGVQLVALDQLRRFAWRRGIAHYAGAGM